jgi:hypothetical protein
MSIKKITYDPRVSQSCDSDPPGNDRFIGAPPKEARKVLLRIAAASSRGRAKVGDEAALKRANGAANDIFKPSGELSGVKKKPEGFIAKAEMRITPLEAQSPAFFSRFARKTRKRGRGVFQLPSGRGGSQPLSGPGGRQSLSGWGGSSASLRQGGAQP